MRVSVKSNAKEFSKGLKRYQRKQMPFATAGAINSTLFDVKKKVIPRTFRGAFKHGKNRGFLNGATMRIEKANKHTLTGVLHDSANLEYLEEQHIQGKPNKPKDGEHIAVPQRGRGRIRRTARGVPVGQRPRQMLQRPDVFKKEGRGGKAGIWQQKKNKLVLLYSLVPSTQVKPRLRYHQNVKKAVDGMFPKRLEKSFAKAWDSRK